MKIESGIIFFWTGTRASIPTGWQDVTAMHGRFPKGTAASTNPGTTGGSATHTHTSGTHTHSINAHTHAVTIGTGYNSGGQGTGSNGTVYNHTHSGVTSGAVASGSVSSPTSTYGAFESNPPYYVVINITPTIATGIIPSGVICLFDAVLPTGFNVCDGTSSTPNLVDKYLVDDWLDGNPGATGGGMQNTHALSHTHTTSHSHAASGDSGSSASNAGSTAGSGVTQPHTHAITLPAVTPSTTDNVSLVTSETNIEPAYTKLLAGQASTSLLPPRGIIGMWLNTLASIPTGWILCDGNGGTVDMRDRHLKITATVGAVGATGGSNTHTHASQNHTHTIAHTHSQTINHAGKTERGDTSGTTYYSVSGTAHDITTDSVNLSLANGATTADSANNEPNYITVAFIKLVQRIETASFLFNFI